MLVSVGGTVAASKLDSAMLREARAAGMISRTCLLLLVLVLLPASLSAQVLDSTRVHELAVQMAEDVRSFERLSEIRPVASQLPTIGEFFGIEFEIPPAGGWANLALDAFHRHEGFEALLAEAARIDEVRGRREGTSHAFTRIARLDGPAVALEAAHDREVLQPMFRSILTGAGPTRLGEVLGWLEEAELDPDDHVRFLASTLGFGSLYRPYLFWMRADSLPEPYRTAVRTGAMSRTTGQDTIPAAVLEAELPAVVEVVRTLDGPDLQSAIRSISTVCTRRELEVCDDLDLPPISPDFGAHTDIINLSGNGLFHQATRRLDRLRATEPPLVIGRLMAQALQSVGRGCGPPTCDLVGADSLAGEWLQEILAVEADAIAGRIERTATYNGNDDLMELQRSLGHYLSTRDLAATRELLDRMEDGAAIGTVLQQGIQAGPRADLIGATEIFLAYAPEGLRPMRVPYADLHRAGRGDLAEELIERAAPYTAASARLARVEGLIAAGRTSEAREVMHALILQNTYEHPVSAPQLTNSLQALRMLDPYLDHVLALPTPLERLNGLYPVVTQWVRVANLQNR